MPIKKPFANTAENTAFMRCFEKEVTERVNIEQSRFISKENVHSFSHGIQWQSHNSSNPDDVSTLQLMRNEVTVKQSDFVEYKIGVLEDTIKNLTDSITQTFMQEMFSLVSNTCDLNGQTVDGKGKTPIESFIEMLEKVEFGVDRNGNPTMPTIHVGPDGFDAFKKDPQFNDPDIKTRIDKLTERKKREALERESLRLARYKEIDG